ncbi:hypothetical protein GCM10010400_72900 [Streptomyces aculeolatus]|uniref:hypothetical protein n=1 Tax=Streptomyces aculeolatus TaxID=270689 RepID=UPI001CEDE17F|nr:hypothetical protein [Streptomyces aculeolatus]
MHLTACRTTAAHGAAWFRLNRHDDPEPADPPEADPGPDEPEPADPEPESDPEGADALGDAGKKALDRMKAERAAARREAAAAKKAAAEAQRKVDEYENLNKTELEKATSRAEAAEKRATAAVQQAVKAEVKALAAREFADPTDADLLGDLSRYVGDDGNVDTEQIAADLDGLLERKPHLRKQAPAPEKPKAPRPDPSQGARPETPPTDYSNAPRDELAKKLGEYGVRLRA